MCIALVSTAHPDYPLILIDNRDEFLDRPTALADWWDAPHDHVLSGRDLQRAEHGTWMGVTKQGRFAVLTNFREEGVEVNKAKSRGGIVTQWLTSDVSGTETPEEFIARLINDTGIQDVGGFSLWVGHIRDKLYPGIVIASNRTAKVDDLVTIVNKPGQTTGLSNSHYGDRSWPKVVHGEELLAKVIQDSIGKGEKQEKLVEALFDLLSTDTLPRPQPDEPWQAYARQLRNSIFIPPVGGHAVEQQSGPSVASADGAQASTNTPISVGSGVYGTQQQTVMLVDKHKKVTFVQRTLYDTNGRALPLAIRDKTFEFIVTN